MQWSDIPRDPPPSRLRQFAGLWILFFLGLAAWQGLGHGRRAVAAVCAALALSLGPLGLIRPQALRPVFVGWMVLAFPIGWLVSHTLLALVYYGLFTPLALVFRVIGRDALALKRPRAATSYWQVRPQVTDPRRYFKQF
jgi:hypothetical protein